MRAEPRSTVASADPFATPAIVVASQPGFEWPAASAAIAFELDQAGYQTSADRSERAVNTRLTLRRDDAGWELVLRDDTRDLRLLARGSTEDSPAEVGVHAAELVYAAQNTPRAVDPSPASDAAPPPAEQPANVATALPNAAQPAVLQASAPMRPPKRRAWTFAFSATASSLGTLGGLLQAQRRWRYLEVGASVGGGRYSGVDESTTVGSRSSVAGSGFVSVGVGSALVLRPGHRLRPRVGLHSDVIAPIIKSTYQSSGGVTGGSLVVTGTNMHLLWAPTLIAGFDVSVGPRLSLRVALRGGVTAALRNLTLADGSAYATPRWFYGGAVGLVF